MFILSQQQNIIISHFIWQRSIIAWVCPDKSSQTLFLNHRSLDLTLLDLNKSQPTVSPDKPMAQLSVAVFEAQSVTNNERSLGVVWKICSQEVPWVIKLYLKAASLGKV